ncbi:hypothetical protein C8J56DRAFT_1104211 [Mycena floridula]|nr:hypothetical protein C8J56DRAFT_1104211 [Mycena floridula]
MDWINRNVNTTVRVLSVDKGEVDVVAMDATVLLRQPSAVFVLDMPTVDSRETPEFDGKSRMAINDRPEVEARHADDSDSRNDKIWAAPGVLTTEWAAYVIMKQAEIARITAETNEWSEKTGNELLRYLGASRVTSQQHKSVADILSSIGSSYDTHPENREQIMKLFANLAAKTRDLRQKVSALKTEMRRGLTMTPETVGWENPLLLGIIDPGEPESEKNVSEEGEALTETNKVRTDSTRKGARRDNRQITINGDVTGESPEVLFPTPPKVPNNIASQANTASQGEPFSVVRQQGLTWSDSTDRVHGNKSNRKEDSWDQAELTSPTRHQKLTPRILEAPTATQHFSSALSDIERHWKELIEFEVSVRARKLELETIAREIRLTMEVGPHSAALDPENQDCTAEYDRLCGGRDKQTLLENCETSQRILQQKANNLKAEILGGEKIFLATRNAEQALVQPNKWEIVEIDSPMSTKSKRVPCVLEVPTRAMRKHQQMPVEDVELTKENLITRGLLWKRDETPRIDRALVDSDSQDQGPAKLNQTEPEIMTEAGGSAASAGAHPYVLDRYDNVSRSFEKQQAGKLDAFWLNLEGELAERGVRIGKPLAATSRYISMVTKDEHVIYGAQFDHIFKKLAFAQHSKLEVIVGRLFKEVPCDLEGNTPGQTLIFFATIIDRRCFIGKSVPFQCGLFLTLSESANGQPKVIRPSNPLYRLVSRAIDERKEEMRLDLSTRLMPIIRPALHLGNLAGASEIRAVLKGGANSETGPPLIELETDLVRLQLITTHLEPITRDSSRILVADRIHFMAQDAFAPPVDGPLPNTKTNLINEITRQVVMVSERSQNETHCRDAMRANARALDYVTEGLPVEQAEVFKFLVKVMVIKHGIDALHTHPERANVNSVISHLDHLIRHSMEKINQDEPIEFPDCTEHELQHNIGKLMQINGYMWKGRIDLAGLPYIPFEIESHIAQLSSNARFMVDGDCRYNPHKLVYDKQSENSVIAPGTLLSSLNGKMSMAEVLAPMPWNTALVPLDLTEEQASQSWRHEQWKRNPKIVVYNTIGMPEPRGHGEERTSAHPHITRVVDYPVFETVSGRHLIMPDPPRVPTTPPVFTTGSHELDRVFRDLIDRVEYSAIPTTSVFEARGQRNETSAPENQMDLDVGPVAPNHGDEDVQSVRTTIPLEQNHEGLGEGQPEINDGELREFLANVQPTYQIKDLDSYHHDDATRTTQSAISLDQVIVKGERGRENEEAGENLPNEDRGHVINVHPVSAHRRPRANSLPSSLQRLSFREPQPDVERDDHDATKDDDLVPLAPMLLARAAPELEEGEISEMSELEGMQRLATPFEDVSLRTSRGNNRAGKHTVQSSACFSCSTVATRHHEEITIYESGSEEDTRFVPDEISAPLVFAPPRLLRNTNERQKRAQKTPPTFRKGLPKARSSPFAVNSNIRVSPGPSPALSVLPVIQVNAVFAEQSTDTAEVTPRRPPLPRLLKRKDRADDDDNNQARGSMVDNDMVLSTAVAAIAGPSSHSNRMLVDQGTLGGFRGGALDFWRQERSGRNLSSQAPSAREPEIFRLVEPNEARARAIKRVEEMTFLRPSRELEVVGEYDDESGDKFSKEEGRAAERDQDGPELPQSSSDVVTEGHSGIEEKREQSGETELRKERCGEGSEGDGYRDICEYSANDIMSWRADMELAAELVSQASTASRSLVGSTESSSPPPQSESDDMDTSTDDFTGQYQDPANSTGERDYARAPLNADNPFAPVIFRGQYTMAEMFHLDQMYQGQAEFPDSVATPRSMRNAEFVHLPSSVRDFAGYRDNSTATIDEATNLRPEPIVQQRNPDRIPGPDHALYSAHAVRRTVVLHKSSLVDYPPVMTDYRLRIGREVAQEKELTQLGKDLGWMCRIISRGMAHIRPDAEDYCLVDADWDVCRKEYEKDEEKFLQVQECSWRESTPRLEEIPQVTDAGVHRRPSTLNHSLFEFTIPVNADLAEATYDGNEQELMHLERAPNALRRFRQLSTSNTSIHSSPQAFWLGPLRQTRADLQLLFTSLVQMLRLREVRDIVNCIPEDFPLKHYLRYHCVFLRLIDKGVPMTVQGFNSECEHQYPPQLRHSNFSSRRYKPRNPLLLHEEDELLFYSVQLLEHLGMFEASNAIRGVRGRHLLRPKDVRRLLRNGYLDSLDHFDHMGQRTWARERVEQS